MPHFPAKAAEDTNFGTIALEDCASFQSFVVDFNVPVLFIKAGVHEDAYEGAFYEYFADPAEGEAESKTYGMDIKGEAAVVNIAGGFGIK
eukprot:9623803-Alexandrium_andersonii.AAC.1